MYKNLHFKIILILAIFTITLMSVIGAVLIGSAFNFYSNDFMTQMEQAFEVNGNLVSELRSAFDLSDYAARQNEILKAYSGVLGIDKYRDYFILDTNGDFLYGSVADSAEAMEKTPNIISAMSGKTGAQKHLRTSYIDYATRIESGDGKNAVIVCVKDSQEDVRSLSVMIFRITVQAMFFGMLAAIVLSFFLAKAITEPIRTLTVGAQRIAEGEFDKSVDVKANDEIGALSETFNYMKDVLKGTLDEISGERRKFETLFLYLNDAVIAFDSFGSLMHINKMAKKLFHFGTPEGERFLKYFNFTQMVRMLNIDYRTNTRQAAITACTMSYMTARRSISCSPISAIPRQIPRATVSCVLSTISPSDMSLINPAGNLSPMFRMSFARRYSVYAARRKPCWNVRLCLPKCAMIFCAWR